MFEIPDVDLDVKNRDAAISALKNFTVASQIANDNLVPHNTGLYFQDIPIDPLTGLAVFPYKEAELLGYYKIDVISNHVYDLVEDNEELEELLKAPIDWDWFLDTRFYEDENPKYRLTHLASYYVLVNHYQPKSIDDLAVLIALIRPPKNRMIGDDWESIKERIFEREEGGYFFKKSHSVAFAYLVSLHAKIINRYLND